MKLYVCANRACRANLRLEGEPKVGEVAVCNDECGAKYVAQQKYWFQFLCQWEPEHRPN